MKPIITLFAASAFISLSASSQAQDIARIYTKTGQCFEYHVNEVDSIVFRPLAPSYEDTMAELVEMTVSNVSPYSLDIDVVKSSRCVKYVIAGVRSSVYTEASFIEEAERSLLPDANYPYQPYLVATASGHYDETHLEKGNLATDESCRGMVLSPNEKYVIAIYAVDVEGQAKLYTQTITTPSATVTAPELQVSLNAVSAGLEDLEASIEVISGNCVKMIVGCTMQTNDKGVAYMSMSAEDRDASILGLYNSSPIVYNGKFNYTFHDNLYPGAQRLIYIIPISDKGEVGQIAYLEMQTQMPVLNGVGSITSASIAQSDYTSVSVNVTTSGAKKVRVMCKPSIDDPSLLSWYLSDARFEEFWYTEADVDAAGNAQVDFPVVKVLYGAYVYVYAVTIDAEGKVSDVIDLVQTYNLANNEANVRGYKLLDEPQQEATVSFDGVGQATMTVSKLGSTVAYTVTKGEGTVDAYVVRTSADMQPENIESYCKTAFENYPEVSATCRKLTFDGDVAKGKEEYMEDYDKNWGGNAIVLVTVDVNGKLKLVSYYLTGTSVVNL